MSFKKLPDNLGMIYVPDCRPVNRKNPCPDCFSCQWCGNERCRICEEKPSTKDQDTVFLGCKINKL